MACHYIQAKAVLWGSVMLLLLGVKACCCLIVGCVLEARRSISWFLGVDLALGRGQGFSILCLHLLPWSQQIGQGGAMTILHWVNILTLRFRCEE